MKAKTFLLGITAMLLLTACDPESNSGRSLGDYEHGVFVVNEGNEVKGTISYLAEDGSLVNDLLGVENPGQNAGSFLQSIFFDGDKAFIISNGSNKITVVNRYTFSYIGAITTGLAVPRYGVVVDGKAYVTNLNTFGSLTDDYVSVIDTESLTTIKNIPMNALADQITAHGNKVYVSNGNYGVGSTITVVESATDVVSRILETDLGPNSLVVEDGKLYILCGSYTDDSSINVLDVNSGLFIRRITFEDTMDNAQNLNIARGKMYFTVDNKVYQAPIDAIAVADTPLIPSAAGSLYGFAVKSDKIYVADAKDYASNGKVYVYSLQGELLSDHTVGLNPNGFYFN
jgi:hypothetical protein